MATGVPFCETPGALLEWEGDLETVRASPPPSWDTVSVKGGPIGDWETAILWENHAGVQGAQMSTPYEL